MRAGYREEAIATWQAAAQACDARAMREVARLLDQAGQKDAAEQQPRKAAQHGGRKELTQLLTFLQTAGWADEVSRLLNSGWSPEEQLQSRPARRASASGPRAASRWQDVSLGAII